MTAVDGSHRSRGLVRNGRFRKEAVIVSDLNTDLWADYRIGRHMGCGRLVTPILSAQETVLRTFAIYSTAAQPDTKERKLLEQFAQVASVAIEHTRAQSLRRSEEKYRDHRRLARCDLYGRY